MVSVVVLLGKRGKSGEAGGIPLVEVRGGESGDAPLCGAKGFTGAPKAAALAAVVATGGKKAAVDVAYTPGSVPYNRPSPEVAEEGTPSTTTPVPVGVPLLLLLLLLLRLLLLLLLESAVELFDSSAVVPCFVALGSDSDLWGAPLFSDDEGMECGEGEGGAPRIVLLGEFPSSES